MIEQFETLETIVRHLFNLFTYIYNYGFLQQISYQFKPVNWFICNRLITVKFIYR